MSSQKQYTREEVSKNNEKGSLLVIIHDKVYNVENFRNEHPGGEEILQQHRGVDASEDFDDIGHSNEAYGLMNKYRVGELVDAEKSNRPPKKWTTQKTKITAKNNCKGINSSLIVSAVIVVLVAIFYFFN